MTRIPESFSSTIVAVGQFNPAIFSPNWLKQNELIGADDAEDAVQSPSLIVSHQITVIDSTWFTLQVLSNQLTLASKGVLSPTLMDLAAGIFELASHTPVSAVGLNFVGEYKLASVDEYHKIGDVFAPKDIWKQMFPADAHSVGMATMMIRVQPGSRDNGPTSNDQKNITIQPSNKFRNGIYLQMNDHHDVSEPTDDKDEMTQAERAAKIVSDCWEPSWKESSTLFDNLLTLALQK